MAFYVEIVRISDNEVIESKGPMTERQAEQISATIYDFEEDSVVVHIVEDNTVEDGN